MSTLEFTNVQGTVRFPVLPPDPYAEYIVYDTFTGVNDTFLVDHTPDKDVINTGWLIYSTGGQPTIQNNKATYPAGGGGLNFINVGVSNNVEVEVIITPPDYAHTDFFSASIGLCVIDSSGDYRGYEAKVFFQDVESNNDLELYIVRDGDYKATLTNGFIWPDEEAHTLKLSLVEGLLTLYIDNVQYLSWQEDTIALTGTLAMFTGSADYTPATYDNFSVK